MLGRGFYDSEYREFSRDNIDAVYAPIDGYRNGATVRANYAATKAGQRRGRHRLRVPEHARGDQPEPADRRDAGWIHQQR